MTVVNQWGRDGQRPGGGSRTGPIILASLLALVFGGAGGYGLARVLGHEPGAPGQVADGPLYQLYSETLKARESASREAGDLRMALAESRAHSAALEASLSALKAGAPAGDGPAAGTGDADLRRRLEALSLERDHLKDQVAETAAAAAKLARSREQALRDASDLKLKLSGLSARIGVLETENQNVSLHDQASQAQMKAANARILALTEEKAAAAADLAALKTQVETLTVALKSAKSETTVLAPESEQSTAPAETPSGPVKGPERLRLAVENALARAPGLKGLTLADRDTLAKHLESGACVTDALEDLFPRVPVLTLRALIRDLDSPC